MKKLFGAIFVMFLFMLTPVSALYYNYDYYDYNYNSRNYYDDYRDYDNYNSRNYYDDYYVPTYRSNWGNVIYNSGYSSRRYYNDDPSATLGYRTFSYGDPYKRGNFHYDNGDGYSRCGYYYSCHKYYPRSYY